jgi:hypothetical protein
MIPNFDAWKLACPAEAWPVPCTECGNSIFEDEAEYEGSRFYRCAECRSSEGSQGIVGVATAFRSI